MPTKFFNNLLPLILVSLVAGSGPSTAAPTADEMVQSALAIGRAVGAATGCPDIAPSRVKSVGDRFTSVLDKLAGNSQNSAAVHDAYVQGMAFGQRAIATHQTDCPTADRDLANQERAVASFDGSKPAPNPAPPAGVGAVAAPPAPASPAPAVAVHGVTDKEIRFGMVAAFSGPSKTYGPQLKVGITTAFNAVNDAGGVNGRKLSLFAADDGFDATRTLDAMKGLYEQSNVFGYVGNYGTPTTIAALPFALSHRMIFFAPYVGGNVVRRDPPDRYVFVYRPSVGQETAAAAQYLLKIRRFRPEQIAFFGQGDAYGDLGYEGVMRTIRALHPNGDAPQILHMSYAVGAVVNVDAAVAQLQQYQRTHAGNPIKVVIMASTKLPAVKFIEKTHDAVPGLVYTNVSGVGASDFADELVLLGPSYANGNIVTQAVPAPDGYSSVVLDYRTKLAKYFPDETANYISLEGYLSAVILIDGLRRAGPNLDTERLVDALEGIQNLDLGIGAMVSFSRADHQAIHKVWGTELDGTGHYKPIDLE